MKRILSAIVTCAVFIVAITIADAAKIAVTAIGNMKQEDGSILLTGSLWRLGTFDISGPNLSIIETSNDLLLIDSFFTPLGEGIVDAGVEEGFNQVAGDGLRINDLGGAGNMFGAISGFTGGTAPSTAPYFPQDTQVYWWVFNSSTASTATQMGIFTASSWLSPNPANQFDELNTVPTGATGVDYILRGSTGGGASGSVVPGSFTELRLEAIPEPSRSLLLLVGVMGAVLVRRRRA